jgi:hypothetical protein
MFYPFSLKSPSDWLNFVPPFLMNLSDEEYTNNEQFHQYIASKLQSYFPEFPSEFLAAIHSLLSNATEAGKFVLIEVLLQVEAIWEVLAQDVNLQPLLTELALSTDRLYSKNAATLSRYLVELHAPVIPSETRAEPIVERLDFPSPEKLEDIVEEAEEEISAMEDDELLKLTSIPKPPTVARAKKRSLPGAPASLPPPPVPAPAEKAESLGAPPPPVPSIAKETEKEVMKNEKEEEIEERKPEGRTIHTHVHYYSRMNPRKTYPFSVTLSSLAKKIARAKAHLLSGEKERETRSEFELKDVTKQLMVEPLLSGCLVQPTFQFVDPERLPKELTFFVTPLVEPGFRATVLNGTLYIKDELGEVLHELILPELSVVSSRISQVAAAIGTLGGGAMPTLDFMFGVNLQTTLAVQLAYVLPALAQSIDFELIVYALEISLLLGAFGVAFLWWWRKERARVAPERSMTLQIPH